MALSQSSGTKERKFFEKILDIYQTPLIGVFHAKFGRGSEKLRSGTIGMTSLGMFMVGKKPMELKSTLKSFISIIDVHEIEFAEPNGLLIRFGKGNEVLRIEGIDRICIVNIIVIERTSLLYSLPGRGSLSLKNVPNDWEEPVIDVVTAHSSVRRYAAACAKYGEAPDKATMDAFEQMETTGGYKIVLKAHMKRCCHAGIVSFALGLEKDLRIIVFDGYSPNTVGRVIHRVLKRNKYLTTLVISGYESFRAGVMRLKQLDKPSVVSWVLRDLNWDQVRIMELLNELLEYSGSIQQLTIKGMPMSLKQAHYIRAKLVNSSSWLTLESLTFSNIMVDQNEGVEVLNAVAVIAAHLPVLRTFVIDKWIGPEILLRTRSGQVLRFMRSEVLRSLSLTHVDIRGKQRAVKFPSQTRNIDFSYCKFTGDSLYMILSCINNHVKFGTCLSLKGVVLGKKNMFWDLAKDLQPMNNLVELDWASIAIDASNVNEFCRIFLSPSIRFLSMKGMFNRQNSNILTIILRHLSHLTLWGLDIGMPLFKDIGPIAAFGDSIIELFKDLIALKGLCHLDISGHRFTNAIHDDLLIFLDDMHELVELGIDGSAIAKFKDMFSLYEIIVDRRVIQSIRTPIADLRRLSTENDLRSTSEFVQFRSKMLARRHMTTKEIRQAYYERAADMSDILTFKDNYPVTLDVDAAEDEFGLVTLSSGSLAVRSLVDMRMSPSTNSSFGEHQASFLQSPYETPIDIPAPKTFTRPSRILEFSRSRGGGAADEHEAAVAINEPNTEPERERDEPSPGKMAQPLGNPFELHDSEAVIVQNPSGVPRAPREVEYNWTVYARVRCDPQFSAL